MTTNKVVSFDTETGLIKPGLLVPKMVCGTFADEDCYEPKLVFRRNIDGYPEWQKKGAVLFDASAACCGLHDYLGEGYHVVCQNAPFDMAVAMREDPSLTTLIFEAYEDDRIHDTMIREMLHDIGRGCLGFDPVTRKPFRYNQASLESRYLGIDRSADKTDPDAWRLRYAELANVPLSQWPEKAVTYPLEDAENCLTLYHKQAEHMNLHDEPAQVRAHFALHLGAAWGIRTNPDAVREFTNRVLTQQRLDQEKFALAGIYRKEKNKYVKDTKALAARVTKAYHGNPPTTPSGAVASDKDTLIESGDQLLEELAETSTNNKLANSYTKGLAHGTKNAMTLKPNPLLETGRTSYRAGPEDMTINPQVLPRKGGVRQCVEARQGRVLVSVDYSTQELRTLAQVCLWTVGYSDMAEALNAGKDLHTALAGRIAGVSYEEAQRLKDAKDARFKDFRQMAKPVNFGLPGGMSAPTLVLTARKGDPPVRFCELSKVLEVCGSKGKVTQYKKREISPTCSACLEIAESMIDLWHSQWTEMQGYFSWVKREVSLSDGITQFVSKRVRGNVSFTNGANGGFQGLAADMSKCALWLVTKDCYASPQSPLYGTRVPAFIHDELLCEVPEPKLHAAAFKVADHMRDAAQAYCPDIDPGKLEPAAMRRWYKDAEMVLDANGRLIPWEPKK